MVRTVIRRRSDGGSGIGEGGEVEDGKDGGGEGCEGIETEETEVNGKGERESVPSSSARKRKSGLFSLKNSFSRLVGTRMNPQRRRFQANDPRQLIMAVRCQDVNRVHNILETCPVDVNGCDSKGVTAVHEAGLDGNWKILLLLLHYRADLNKKDNEGLTCLDYAVFGGHFECAQYLIDNGATSASVRDGMPTFFSGNNY